MSGWHGAGGQGTGREDTPRRRRATSRALWKLWVMRHAGFLAWTVVAMGGIAVGCVLTGFWRLPPTLAAMACVTALAWGVRGWVLRQRMDAIHQAPLPPFLRAKLRGVHPHLNDRDCDLVERGLRQFFMACLRSRGKFVAMPSQAVDALWHEFILHTRAYRDWCALTLGRFLHHTPAEALGRFGPQNDGLRRAWYWACREESIHPRKPARLPLLFALDAKLGISGGFHYVPDCSGVRRDDGNGIVQCGSDFSDPSYSGDVANWGGADNSAGFEGSSASAEGGGGDAGGDGGGGGCGGGD